MRKVFKYLEPLWLDNKNKSISLRGVAAIALIVNFIINVDGAASIVVKVLKLMFQDKEVDPVLISAMSGNLAQIAMILGIEAGLIAALLALKTYQPVQADFTSVQTTAKTETKKVEVSKPENQVE